MTLISRRPQGTIVFAMALALFEPAAGAASPAVQRTVTDRATVTLDELLAFAQQHSPRLRVAQAHRGYADAARADAKPRLRRNPEVEFGIGPRIGAFGGGVDFDFIASATQPVEISGERRRRKSLARATAQRVDADSSSAAWANEREIRLAYYGSLVAQERVRAAQLLVDSAQAMVDIADRRVRAGDAAGLELRIAKIDLAQTKRVVIEMRREARAAQLELCELSGWPVDSPPLPSGSIEPRPAVPSLPATLERIEAEHPSSRSAQALVAEAEARADLADREAWPAPGLGFSVAREGSAGSPANYIVLGTVGIALPLWQRNQGERARTRTDARVAQAEAEQIGQALRVEVVRAHADLVAASEQLELYRADVMPTFAESLQQLERGVAAGELSLVDAAAVRERFIRGQLEALQAYGEYYRAFVELQSLLQKPKTVDQGER